MKTVRLVTLLFLLVSLIGAGCESGKKRVLIRYKLKPDMKLDYEQTSKGSVMVTAGDSVIRDSYNDITTYLTWLVKGVDSTQTAEIQESKSFHYRSLDRRDSSMTDTVEPGQDLILYVTPMGKLKDIKVTADSMSWMASYIQKYFEQGAPLFPEDEVYQGHTWRQTSTVVLPDGPIEASTKFTIKSFARHQGYDCVIIAYDGNLALPIEPFETKEYRLVDGVDRVKSTGYQYFAYKEGFIVENSERWVVDGIRRRLYENGDTVKVMVALEYDVDQVLKDARIP